MNQWYPCESKIDIEVRSRTHYICQTCYEGFDALGLLGTSDEVRGPYFKAPDAIVSRLLNGLGWNQPQLANRDGTCCCCGAEHVRFARLHVRTEVGPNHPHPYGAHKARETNGEFESDPPSPTRRRLTHVKANRDLIDENLFEKAIVRIVRTTETEDADGNPKVTETAVWGSAEEWVDADLATVLVTLRAEGPDKATWRIERRTPWSTI